MHHQVDSALIYEVERRLLECGMRVLTIEPEEIALSLKSDAWPYLARFLTLRPAVAQQSAGRPARGVRVELGLHRDTLNWRILVHEVFPGPGVGDFYQDFSSLDAAISAIRHLHFAAPTIIDGWLVPLHRLPFWPPRQAQIERVVGQARVQPYADFVKYARRLSARIQQELPDPANRYERVGWDFAGIRHLRDLERILYLRRDLEEAIIVADTPPTWGWPRMLSSDQA